MGRSTTTYGVSGAAVSTTQIITTGRELSNSTPVQMDKELPLLNPNVTPFFTLSMSGKVPRREVGGLTYLNEDYVIVPEFDTLVSNSDAISAGASNSGTWTVNDASIFEPWATVRNFNTGDVGMVEAVNTSTDALTISAIAGAIGAGTSGDVIGRLSNAMDEGGGIPLNRAVIPTRYTNYTQKSMRPIRITEEARNSADYHGNPGEFYRRTHKSELLAFVRDIEWSMLFNPGPFLAAPATGIVLPADQTTSVGITMGFDYALQTYGATDSVVEATTVSKSTVLNWLESCAQYTEGVKPWIFCSTKFFAALQDWGIGQVDFKPSEKPQTFGLNIGNIVLPVGGSLTARIVPHRMLRERADGDWNYAFYVDFSQGAIKTVIHHGMGERVLRNVRDGSIPFGQQVDVIYSRWGTQYSLLEKSGRLRFKDWS